MGAKSGASLLNVTDSMGSWYNIGSDLNWVRRSQKVASDSKCLNQMFHVEAVPCLWSELICQLLLEVGQVLCVGISSVACQSVWSIHANLHTEGARLITAQWLMTHYWMKGVDMCICWCIHNQEFAAGSDDYLILTYIHNLKPFTKTAFHVIIYCFGLFVHYWLYELHLVCCIKYDIQKKEMSNIRGPCRWSRCKKEVSIKNFCSIFLLHK